MSNLIITLKEKDTNTETNFIFNNGVYKLLPGTTDNFVENQVDKINFVPIENVFLLMIGSSDTIQSVSQKQDIYNKYLNLSNYNFSNYNINISTENNICLFDSDTLNLSRIKIFIQSAQIFIQQKLQMNMELIQRIQRLGLLLFYILLTI